MDKTYTGIRTERGVLVFADGCPLDPRLDLARKSPSGFEWGYGGSGPGQLALAILADLLQDDAEALALFQDFKWRVIANLRGPSWTLTAGQLRDAVAALKADHVADLRDRSREKSAGF